MLFGYPVSATAKNWLHDCLCETLRSIHATIQTVKTPPEWPEIIPEPYRKSLKRRTGLRDRLNTYWKALEKLSIAEQAQILKALHDQNEIALLLSCQHSCDAINGLPKSIRKPVSDLFTFAFGLLTDLDIRDHQYKHIYDTMRHRICPFCGCEHFDSPKENNKQDSPRENNKKNNNKERREALDHYLAESLYPFAAANLRNLAPIGNKCNSYKADQDLLRRDNSTSRKSFDPYNCTGVRLSLENSQPFAGTLTPTGQIPKWQIDFQPDSEEITTWDEVFHIRERYKKNILDKEFNSWLEHFKDWCKSAKITPSSHEEWVDALERYATLYETMGISERAFLKAAVFRMLHTHCKKGDQRIVNLIRNV